MLKQLNINKKDKYYLLFILLFSSILVGYYINFNNNLGIYCSDVYVYLLNALYYTGTNIRSTSTIYLSPTICYLTSIFFKMGFADKLAINIVTGAFAVFGNIGFYLLLKRFYSEKLSLAGTVIYSSLSLYLTWLANGTLDVPAVSLTIWIGLFSIIAIKNDPKFYPIAIIFIVIGIFTRYQILITLPAFLLYYIHEKGFKIEKNDLKYFIVGIIIGLAIILFIYTNLLSLGYGNFDAGDQISNGISGVQGSKIDPAYNTNESYYVANFLNFISSSHVVIDGNPILENPTPLSWAILLILILGMGLWLYEHKRKANKKDIIPLIFFIIAIFSFTQTSSVITIIFVLIGLYFLGKDSDNKIIYLMLGWIFSNIIFYSYYSIKVNRYILPIFPAVIYFVILSVDTINKRFKINENIIPIALIVLFIIQAFTFTLTFDVDKDYNSPEEVSDYIITNYPDYKNISIGVHNIRAYNWWLGGNLVPIMSHEEKLIDKSNVTFYISDSKLNNVVNYTEMKKINNIYIYEKNGV